MKRLTLITVILGTALALVPVASAVVLSDGAGGTGGTAVVPSTQPTNDATQAVIARSEGLAKYYGSDPATQAVLLRSTGLANYYGGLGGVTLRPDILGGSGGSGITPISTGNSFDWNTTISATLAALLLAAMAGAIVTRRKHSLSF